MKKRLHFLVLICFIFCECVSSKKIPEPPEYFEVVPVVLPKPATKIQKVIVPPVDQAIVKQKLKNKEIIDRYAKILAVPPDSLNIYLYTFIDDWMNTPYKWGGTDKSGIDCSAFIRLLFKEIYDMKLPRTSLEQVLTQRVEKFSSIKYLAEGDLLFFRTTQGKLVSHVGFYLRNNRFINSSSHKGVVIYNFDNYWKTRFVTAARIRQNVAKKDLPDFTTR